MAEVGEMAMVQNENRNLGLVVQLRAAHPELPDFGAMEACMEKLMRQQELMMQQLEQQQEIDMDLWSSCGLGFCWKSLFCTWLFPLDKSIQNVHSCQDRNWVQRLT